MTFDVINKDRELLWFALLSFIFSGAIAVAMIFPTLVAAMLEEGVKPETFQLFEYLIIFLTYFGVAFIATFFNVCVVSTTKVRFAGGNDTIGESIGFAFSCIGLIVQWSLLSATVGLLLRLLHNFASRFGRPPADFTHWNGLDNRHYFCRPRDPQSVSAGKDGRELVEVADSLQRATVYTTA